MSGTVIVMLLWCGLCAGGLVMCLIYALIDKLCDKFPKIAKWIDDE